MPPSRALGAAQGFLQRGANGGDVGTVPPLPGASLCEGCAAPAPAESLCSPSPRPPDPPGLAAARVGQVGKQRKAAGAALTMVPMLYVAAGPMVWW